MSVTDGSGEKPGFREAAERMAKQLREGGMAPERIEKVVRDTQIRVHNGAVQKKDKP